MSNAQFSAATNRTVGDSGCFEIEATESRLHRFQEEWIRMSLGQSRERFERTRRLPERFLLRESAKRVGPWICAIGALASAFGALLFYGDKDWGGVAVWSGMSLAFVVLAVLYANLHWIDRFSEGLYRRTRARFEQKVRRSFEPLFQNAPYKVRYELDDGEWIVHSDTSGERKVPIKPGLKALRGENAYCLMKTGLLGEAVGGAMFETAEQRGLIEAFLRRQGIPIQDSE